MILQLQSSLTQSCSYQGDIAWPHKSSYPKMELPVEDLTQLRINKVTQCVISPCVRTHTASPSPASNLSVNNDTTINFGKLFNHNYTIDPPPYISSHNEFYPNGTATCWSPNPNPLQNQTMNMTLLSLDYSPMREDRLANPDAFAVCPVTSFYDYLTTLLESSVNITYSSSSPSSSSSSSPSTNKTSSWGFQQISQAAPSMERILTSDLQSIAADIAASLTRYSHERSNTRTVAGTVFVPRVYVAVAWGFLALPAVVYCVGDGCACFDGFRAGEEVVCEEC